MVFQNRENNAAQPDKKDESDMNFEHTHQVRLFHSISGLIPGLVLIMIGVLLMLSHWGMLNGQWWQYFLVGLGVIFLIEAWIIYINPVTRRPILGRIAAALALIIAGLVFLFDEGKWWPLVLIVIGVGLVLFYVFRRR
jgi:hypothetical protein